MTKNNLGGIPALKGKGLNLPFPLEILAASLGGKNMIGHQDVKKKLRRALVAFLVSLLPSGIVLIQTLILILSPSISVSWYDWLDGIWKIFLSITGLFTYLLYLGFKDLETDKSNEEREKK